METIKDAGLGIRLAAAAIDLAIMAGPIVGGVVYYLIINGKEVANLPALVLMFVVVVLWKKYGATPGKMFLGLKVISNDLQPLTYGQAIGRYFSYALSSYWILAAAIVLRNAPH